MPTAYKVAASVGVCFSLLIGVAFVPAISFTRVVNFGSVGHPIMQAIQDRGSLSYLLLGFGMAPFSRPVVKIVAINGTLWTLNYSARGTVVTQIRQGTPVHNPIILEAVRAELNDSGIPSVVVILGLRNSGGDTVNLTISVDGVGTGFVKNLGGGSTQVATVIVYASPVPRLGQLLPIDVEGTLVNGSFFGLLSAATVADG